MYEDFVRKFLLIQFISILPTATLQTETKLVEAAVPFKKLSKAGEITEISANVTLNENGDGIQFIISWYDNIPEGTSYNIVITTLNETGCNEPPCSAYGVTKKAKQVVIPENDMEHTDQNECGFMFGCKYAVKVESSNAAISGYSTISVPYCVLGLCSCQYAAALPEVISSVRIPNNKTIIYNWAINATMTSSQWKLHLIVSEQANPLLSWGGKFIPITEHFYTLQNASHVKLNDALQGTFKIQTPKQLVSKTVLNLRSYLIDELYCEGPEHFTKVSVPEFFEYQASNETANFNMVIVLNLLSILLIGTTFLLMIYFWWKRNKLTNFQHGEISGFFEMKDNVNYVDKYIEEAQAKGTVDIYEIPPTDIHIGHEIGEGAFGRVYKAVAINLRRVQGSKIVAVKQLKNNPTAEEVADFSREIDMLKKVGIHKNIVTFIGCCTIRTPYFMVMEFVGRGDLLSYLRTVRLDVSKLSLNRKIDFINSKSSQLERKLKYIKLQLYSQSLDSSNENSNQAKSSVAETTYTIVENEDFNEPFEYVLDHKELHDFALQIANGMRFLEDQKITHRDLAARNVLIDDNKTLKISDFGLSRHGIYSNTKSRKLPLRWLSIEAICDNIYSSKSDVWAYGVVLWEIGTLGASPYPTVSNHELVSYLLSGKRLEKPEICTDQVFDIMLQCWDENVENRPTFHELYKILSPSAVYVDINRISDDYVFPPI